MQARAVAVVVAEDGSDAPVTRLAPAPSDRSRSASGAEQPILPGFYPDPTVCRVGGDYYLATSSFEYFPGAPLWHSTDLVTWSQIGHALTRRSQFREGSALPSTGIYGLTLRHHDGRFWLITTNVSDHDAGQVLVTAEDPRGPWSDPVLIPDAVGIDPDLCWDGETCFLTWKAMDFRVERGILQARLDLATGRLGPAYPIWQGSGLAAVEAPHLYRIRNRWYLLLAEGGTERGHAVTVARAEHPWGPFEPCPWNPVLSHRSLGHPVQSTGHADLVQTPEGDWAAVYLGARPRGSTPGFHVLGRETFVAGVTWVEGWPLFDEQHFEVPLPDTDFADDFSSARLHDRWVVPRGELEAVGLPAAPTGLLMPPSRDALPAVLCTRVRDHSWTAEATVEGDGRFTVRLDERHWYGVDREAGVVSSVAQIGDLRQRLRSSAVTRAQLVLRIESVPPASRPVPFGHGGPDDIVLSFDDEDGRHELGRLDGRYLSTEVASGFTGRMLAIGSNGSETLVRSVSYRAHRR